MILWQLLLSFLQVGMFSIGGGYAAMPLIQSQVVETYGWLTMSEFTDLITIAEMTPGPIAVNSATFVGIRIAGIPGAIVATVGCILPSIIIVSILARIYARYREGLAMQTVLTCLRSTVVALIAAAGVSILQNVVFAGLPLLMTNVQWIPLGIFTSALFALRRWKLNPILVMALCGVGYLLISLATGTLPAA